MQIGNYCDINGGAFEEREWLRLQGIAASEVSANAEITLSHAHSGLAVT